MFIELLPKVSEATWHIAGVLKHIKHWNPIFACGFHAHIFAVILPKPLWQGFVDINATSLAINE
jgi:hypothetical protein